MAIVGNVFNSTIILQHLEEKYNFTTFSTLQDWRESREPGAGTAIKPGTNVAVSLTWNEATTEILLEFTDIIETDLYFDYLSDNRKFDSQRLVSNYKSIGHVIGTNIDEILYIFDGAMQAITSA
jgi:hypothetical protein